MDAYNRLAGGWWFGLECGWVLNLEVGMRTYIKGYRYRVVRFLHIVVWMLIVVFSINFLFRSVEVFSPGERKKESRFLSGICNFMINSSTPILKYVGEEDKESLFVYNNFNSMFPINQYAMEYRGMERNFYIDVPDRGMYITESVRNRLNVKYYSSMILLDIQNKDLKNMDYIIHNIDNPFKVLGGGGIGRLALSSNTLTGIIPIDIISGEVYMDYDHHVNSYDRDEAMETLNVGKGETFSLEQLLNRQFLYNNFYILDAATSIDDSFFDAKYFLEKDFTMEKDSEKPQILVYHTHSQEAFIDSREGKVEDTIVGVGAYLTELLERKYGYKVIHDTSEYDMMEGYIERNLAYNHAGDGVAKILKENPSIQVIIDVHRDGNDFGMKRVTTIGDKDTAKIMLFNGLVRNTKGKIEYYNNPYIKDNLAFSLRLQLKGRELFPGVMYKNYLHAYRYNLHFRERSILAEVGTNWNTVDEAMNAMEYLAFLLDDVLTKK